MGFLLGTDIKAFTTGGQVLTITMDLSGIAWVPGDVGVIWCGSNDNATPGWSNPTGGYTIATSQNTGSGADRAGAFFYKLLDGSDDDNPQFRLANKSGFTRTLTGLIMIWRGLDGTEDGADSTAPSSGADSATPPLTTTKQYTRIFSCYYHRGTVEGHIAPSGYTLHTGLPTTSRLFLATKVLTTAGLETPGNWGSSPSMGSAAEVLATVAMPVAIIELEALTVPYP